MAKPKLTPEQRERLHAFVAAQIRLDPERSGRAVKQKAEEALGIELSHSGWYRTYWPSKIERRAIANGGGTPDPEPAETAPNTVEKPEPVAEVGPAADAEPEPEPEAEPQPAPARDADTQSKPVVAGERSWQHKGPDGYARATETGDGRVLIAARIVVSRRTAAAVARAALEHGMHG